MKKIISLLSVIVIMASVFAIPAAAYKPGYDQLEDIRWYGGYKPESGLSVMSDVDKGVRCVFKYDAVDMWANRVVAGWDYNLSSSDTLKAGVSPDKEGIYVHLEDLKWDVPKPTPSKPNPEPSIMITISVTQGGWSDRRSLMFWIIRGKEEKYRMAVLRGNDPDEKNINQFAMDYKELSEPIGKEINFYFRRTSSSVWTLNVNKNVFTFDDKTVVSDRFPTKNPLSLNLGTWNSGGPVEYTVSDLWGYGVIEYGKKSGGKYVINPAPAFVQSVRKATPATTTTTKKNETTAKPSGTPGTTVGGASTTGDVSGTDTTVSGNTDLTSTDSTQETEISQSTVSTRDDKQAGSDTDNKRGSGAVIWIIVALIAAVLIGGGIAFYFMFIKKK